MNRPDLRTEALERDRGCAWPGCHVAHPLEMAHIWPSGMGGDPKGVRDVLSNVWMLCRFHHDHFDGRAPQKQAEYRRLVQAYVALKGAP